MRCKYTYLKNSNTSDIISKQEFIETSIRGFPITFYRNNKMIDIPDLSGYVEISEKKYKRYLKKINRKAVI